MIADLLKDSDKYELEHQQKKNRVRPNPKYTIHTLMGDMKRWYEGDIFYSDYKINEQRYKVLLDYYNEKEGITDDKG